MSDCITGFGLTWPSSGIIISCFSKVTFTKSRTSVTIIIIVIIIIIIAYS